MSDGRRNNGTYARGTAEERFMRHVAVDEHGCWMWSASAQSGRQYILFHVERGKQERAHAWAYKHFIGPVPDGMVLDHTCHSNDLSCAGGPTCRHRRCVNPEHLEPVTPLENTRRGRGNGKETHCPQGHPYVAENVYRDTKNRRKCRSCMNSNRIRLGLMRTSQHGTTTGYTYGCRCDRCRDAARTYNTSRRRRNRVAA